MYELVRVSRVTVVFIAALVFIATLTVAVAVGSAAASPATAQGAADTSSETRYQEAWYREVAEGRYDEALAIYQELAEKRGIERGLKARCVFRSGVCLSRLQRHDEAAAAYARVIGEFDDVSSIAADARRMIAGESEADASFRRKVDDLIDMLGDKSEAVRIKAYPRLKEIGPRCAPMLLSAMAQGEYFASQGAARLLCGFARDDDELFRSVVSAMRTGDEIVFANLTRSIGSDYSKTLGSHPGLSVAQLIQLLDDPDERIREAAAEGLRRSTDDQARAKLVSLVEDDNAAIRCIALHEIGRTGRFEDTWPTDLDTRFALLLNAIDDDDSAVRDAAVAGASQILDSIVRSRTPEVRLEMLHALKEKISASPEIETSVIRVLGAHQREFWSRDEYRRSVILAGPSDDDVFNRVARHAADASSTVRAEAAHLLSASRRAEAVSPLATCLYAESPALVDVAVKGLGILDHPDCAEHLLVFLREGKMEQSKEVAMSVLLSKLQSDAVIAALVAQLATVPLIWVDDLMEKIRLDARLGRIAIEQYPGLRTHARREVLRLVQRQGLDDGREVVMSALSDRDLYTDALGAAATMRLEEAVPRIVELLDDSQPGVRTTAIDALVVVGGAAFISEVAESLTDEHSGVCSKASSALENLGDRRALGAALQVLDRVHPGNGKYALEVVEHYAAPRDADVVAAAIDENFLSRHATIAGNAIHLLGKLGSRASIPVIRPYLDSPQVQLRRIGLQALGAIDSEAMFEDICAAATSPDRQLRSMAMSLLGKSLDPRALEPLTRALEDPNVANQAAQALESLGDPRAIPALIAHLPEARQRKVTLREGSYEREVNRYDMLWTLRSYPAEAAIAALDGVIGDDELDIKRRMDAVRVLARIEHPSVGERIQKLLAHSNSLIRAEAIYAVGRSLDPGALPQLVKNLRDGDGSIRTAARHAIGEIRFFLEQQEFAGANADRVGAGNPALDAILEMLAAPEATVRVAAVKALAAIDSPRALEALVKLRKDPDAAVREAVDAALDALTQGR